MEILLVGKLLCFPLWGCRCVNGNKFSVVLISDLLVGVCRGSDNFLRLSTFMKMSSAEVLINWPVLIAKWEMCWAMTTDVYLIYATFSWKIEIDVFCACDFLVNISIKVNFHLAWMMKTLTLWNMSLNFQSDLKTFPMFAQNPLVFILLY